MTDGKSLQNQFLGAADEVTGSCLRVDTVDWLEKFRNPPARALVVHGEGETAAAFAALTRETLRWPSVEVPHRGDRIPIA